MPDRINLEINCPCCEQPLSVQYYPGDPGKTYGPPEQCYPPEPDEVDIASPHPKRCECEDYVSRLHMKRVNPFDAGNVRLIPGEEQYNEDLLERAREAATALEDAYYEDLAERDHDPN
jgi:hypothetical protein